MVKLTNERRREELYQLQQRLEEAIEQTAKGITPEEVRSLLQEVFDGQYSHKYPEIRERNDKARDLFTFFALQGIMSYKEFVLGLHELGIFPVVPMPDK